MVVFLSYLTKTKGITRLVLCHLSIRTEKTDNVGVWNNYSCDSNVLLFLKPTINKQVATIPHKMSEKDRKQSNNKENNISKSLSHWSALQFTGRCDVCSHSRSDHRETEQITDTDLCPFHQIGSTFDVFFLPGLFDVVRKKQ